MVNFHIPRHPQQAHRSPATQDVPQVAGWNYFSRTQARIGLPELIESLGDNSPGKEKFGKNAQSMARNLAFNDWAPVVSREPPLEMCPHGGDLDNSTQCDWVGSKKVFNTETCLHFPGERESRSRRGELVTGEAGSPQGIFVHFLDFGRGPRNHCCTVARKNHPVL